MFSYMAFPAEHYLRIRTTNVVERVNREIKRRTKVVSVFPDVESVLRLVGIEIVERDRNWSLKRGYFIKKSWMKPANPRTADTYCRFSEPTNYTT